jgi:hypothetical protein
MYLTKRNIILNIKGKPQFVTIQRTLGPRTDNARMPALDCSIVIKHYIQYPQLCILYFKIGNRKTNFAKHMLHIRQSVGPKEDIMNILHATKNG